MTEKSEEIVIAESEETKLLNADMASVVFSNLKLFINDYMKRFDPIFKIVEDTKLNLATLSTLLSEKKVFNLEEFKECFDKIYQSFGVVLDDGSMNGTVILTKYNWESERSTDK